MAEALLELSRDQQDLSRCQGPRQCQPARMPRRGVGPDRRERRRQIDADARAGRRIDRAERGREIRIGAGNDYARMTVSEATRAGIAFAHQELTCSGISTSRPTYS